MFHCLLLAKGNGTEDNYVVFPLAEYFGRWGDKRVFIEFPLLLSILNLLNFKNLPQPLHKEVTVSYLFIFC